MKKRAILIGMYLTAAVFMVSCGGPGTGGQVEKKAEETDKRGKVTAETTAGEDGAGEDGETYKGQCETFAYKEYFRNDKKYIGEKIKVDILVDQVIEGDFRGYDADGREYYVSDLRTGEDKFRIMEEDVLTVYGEYAGVQQITRAIGEYDADIFCIDGKYIELHEEGAETDTNDGKDIFAMSAGNYYFSSGAGGWGTSLELRADGSFFGYHSDSDMGSSGDGYDSTVYQSEFHGRFKDPVKIDDYSYSMELDGEVMIDSSMGEYVEDRVLYIGTDPYGMEVGKEFRIYLPGAPVAQLPQDFVSWVYGAGDYLSSYGIHNIEGGYGFVQVGTETYDQSGVYGTNGGGMGDGQENDYIFPDSSTRLLTEQDLAGYDQDTLRIAKNEIYARHGRIFTSDDLRAYFGAKDWYTGTIPGDQFDEKVFNQIEKDNIRSIQSYMDGAGASASAGTGSAGYQSRGLTFEDPDALPQKIGQYHYYADPSDKDGLQMVLTIDQGLWYVTFFVGETQLERSTIFTDVQNDQVYLDETMMTSLYTSDYGRYATYDCPGSEFNGTYTYLP